VAEDHQTKNAMALVNKGAAEIVRDTEAVARGMQEAVALAKDRERLERLSKNIKSLAISDSAERVVREVEAQLTTK
jgi:UDP-N-acetylglucosamine--N-acetylmuramyl-(pentapeptide) pyrophosphoryl-undecaprenol N-acetylglucosamine transferase